MRLFVLYTYTKKFSNINAGFAVKEMFLGMKIKAYLTNNTSKIRKITLVFDTNIFDSYAILYHPNTTMHECDTSASILVL